MARSEYRLRTEAALTEREVADLVHRTQSDISRLEGEEYGGHLVEMLHRIATALNKTMTVVMTAEELRSYGKGEAK